jgi:nicotinamide-nucleotide amidase
MQHKSNVSIEMIATGEELLDGRVVNTNARDLAIALEPYGLKLSRVTVVGDGAKDLESIFREVAARADIAIVTGGLGPTDDDRTTEALAQVAAVPLERQPELVAKIENFFQARNHPIFASHLKQADIPHGANVIANHVGTASGFAVDIERCRFFVLPGVPRELRPMLNHGVIPELLSIAAISANSVKRRTFRCFGWSESLTAEALVDLYPLPDDIEIGYRANFPEVHVTVKAQTQTECENSAETFSQFCNQVRQRIQLVVFSESEQSFVGSLGKILRDHKLHLAVAESCTGGMVGAMLSAEPGSSDFFLASAVTYSNHAKSKILGIDEALISQHGAVSEITARKMAEGALCIADADIAAAITGIAGPDGGSPHKPVGTLHIAAATPQRTEHRALMLHGDRERIRTLAAYASLQLIRCLITGNPSLPLHP